ncbi:tumor necrosis factor receptor superfamily member 10B isoform X3 [Melanerpes formicivorus]|uniref:tumor necrosis factor receptor superfamily member 10B isoform X3 n=1 Tax=Melanerpes formicivorus TaxID=211600 RepID=UPI00358E86D7
MRPVPRCDPRWLCLLLPLPLLLLLTQQVSLGAAAAAALKRRDKSDPLEPARHTDHYSGTCPAGEHAEQHCEGQNCSTTCLPCNDNEFTEYPNDFLKCLRCRVCREDQVEISPCQATRDTQCACRSGTFCSPDHPCEMCQKCRPRCPKGEVELAPCLPHSDRRCGPPTGTFSDSSNNVLLAVGVVVLVLLLLLVLFILWRCCCRRSSGDGRDLSSKSCSTLVMVPRTSAIPRRNLVPVPGSDPVKVLRRSFDLFAEVVPLKDWRRYGRALDLPDNDIDLAEQNNKYTRECFVQILTTWHHKQGLNASVNTLLDTLHQISLGGIADSISTSLVQQGLFQHEGS